MQTFLSGATNLERWTSVVESLPAALHEKLAQDVMKIENSIRSPKMSFDRSEAKAFKASVFGHLNCYARVSLALAIRARTCLWPGEGHYVGDEIRCLEGIGDITATKPASPLKGCLSTFMHKHFFTSRYVIENIGAHWKLEKSPKKLLRMIEEVADHCGNVPEEWQKLLLRRFVDEAFMERAKAQRLTGQWLIFKEFAGKKYYLDLVHHDEKNEEILEKLRLSCSSEYPFLFDF